MNDHALRLLEFGEIRAELIHYAWSEDGKKRLAGEGFLRSAKELEQIRRPAAEFRRLLDSDAAPPALNLPDITGLVKIAEKPGAVLEPAELGTIGSYLRQMKILKNYLKKGGGILREEAEGLPAMSGLSAKIDGIIDREGNVRDNDIPSLSRLRRRIRAYRKDLDALAASYLGNSDLRGYWQSDTASQKDGRMALPLASNFRGRIKGVVHEISSSGATAFFEPLDIFEKNNDIAETENEYRRELFQILKDLTAAAGEAANDLLYLSGRLALIDSWQARAVYGKRHECFPAAVADSPERDFILSAARHPLLGAKAVPIDIRLAEGTRILLVTGPNTGGKTLALKTAGLLALMNQFGLDIPAAGDSSLPLFDDIFVDMGDEQSIAESLSTFSAHISNLAKIVSSCARASLVLLDELGSGTDPEQGAAIAMAFLDTLAERGVYAMVTTHLGSLKHYAYSRPGVSNASVLFDAEAFKPAYKIIPGVPGESHAFEIAERCGVPALIIDRARAYMSGSETDSARLIRSLTEKEAEIAQTLRQQRKLLADLEEERRLLAEKQSELSGREIRLRREGLTEARRFLAETRKQFEALVHELRQAGRSAAPDAGEQTARYTQELRSLTGEIQRRIKTEEQKIEELTALARPARSGPLEEGMQVLIGDPPRGAVLERRLPGGRWQLTAGAIRLCLPESEIVSVQASIPQKPEIQINLTQTAGEPARFELDIRGLRAEEAIAALIKQTDRAIIQSLQEFGVIHGKGEGVLQTAVHDYLRGHPAVAEFRFAHPDQGGTGKTFVKLKG
ncbi:MAG: endonuclease MutS2 [Spirochaetales bacterium]|jgi:DNA mismatch repair protein MutS2|nr:endonuclease MutS2 [Spirochaetales bacterium]